MASSTSFDPGDSTLGLNGTSHPNPSYDYLSGLVPRKLKELFRWSEYLAFNSAHIYGVVRKFGEYPITTFIYDTTSPNEKERHQELFDKKIKLKGFLTQVSFDKYIYGNAFVSVFEPIKRWLKCPKCAVKEDVRVASYKYVDTTTTFRLKCRKCNMDVTAEVEDEKLIDASKINLIRWDPKLIDIDHNPVTGQSVYYYTIPRAIVQQVKEGNKHLIGTMPMEMLQAMKAKKTFKFGEGQLFHLKVPGPAGVDAQWGFPPITSAIKNFLFAATLRKANEAIALEHITPFRVIHPQGASGNGDPVMQMNLDEWRREIETNYKLFRRDPLRIQFSPIPVGVQNIGGDGRAMLTLGELKAAEEAIVISMGVPMEFLNGGLGQTKGEITLRMIENQLQTHVEDLNGLVQWIEQKCARFLGWRSIPTRLADFKMVDDVENKQMYFQLWQNGKISDTKIGEILGIDWEHERKQKAEDTLAETKSQMALEAAQKKMQNSLSQQAANKAQMAQGGVQYDQQAIIAQADQMAQELAGLDAGSRRSRMDSLKNEDLVMASVVRERLEQMGQDQEQAAKAQTKQGRAEDENAMSEGELLYGLEHEPDMFVRAEYRRELARQLRVQRMEDDE